MQASARARLPKEAPLAAPGGLLRPVTCVRLLTADDPNRTEAGEAADDRDGKQTRSHRVDHERIRNRCRITILANWTRAESVLQKELLPALSVWQWRLRMLLDKVSEMNAKVLL